MDRRTLIFIFGMTAIFFLMNQWFYSKKDSVDPNPILQPPTEIVITGKGMPKPLGAEAIKSLGIVKLYEDISLEGSFVYALSQGEVFLGLSGNRDLPSEVYYISPREEEISIGIQRLKLRVAPTGPNTPFLYSKYPLLKLEIPWIPDELNFSASLLYFEEDQIYTIKGKAIGSNQLDLEAKPPKNALVFYVDGKNASAYALYDSQTNKLAYLDHIPEFENFSALRYIDDSKIKVVRNKEQYYVLENEFIQLVFSNFNGALAEINLPFHSETHPYSVVKEISFDRIIQENYPMNNTFPQRESLVADGQGGIKKQSPQFGGYYPLLRRNILGSGGDTQIDIDPHYYALNVFQQDVATEMQEFKVRRFEKDLIEFELMEKHRKITKTFSLPKNPLTQPYVFDMDLKVEGDARHLFLSLGVPEVELISGTFAPSLKYRTFHGQKGKVEEIKTPKILTTYSHLTADWYSNGNGFFGVILDPLDKAVPGLSVHPISGELVPSRITIIDPQFDRYPTDKYPGYAMHTPVLSKPGVTKYRIFAGPFDKNILQTVDNSFMNPINGGTPDFIEAQSYHGWFAFISKPFAQFLFMIMNLFHSITHSWGISIILLTIALRIMLYPLNNWSIKSQAKMQKIAPKLKEIQEKYKKDPKRIQMETMNLYRKEGGNPLGGCFPILIQFPFLFGMLDLLKSSFQLRGASFIPGWIDNLSAPDVLFSWEYPIPFLGTSFHLLPILLGLIMYLQQKLVPSANKQAPVTDMQKQSKTMGNVMAIAFTFMFYKFPSGLNLYWISSTLLGILQQWWVTKQKTSITQGKK